MFMVALGLVDDKGDAQGGLFGTAVATMGMLSTAVCVIFLLETGCLNPSLAP